jgi:eukaryotic-like serine/threonine-protein kinase
VPDDPDFRLDTRLDRFGARVAADDSIEGQRLHRAVRARLLDETVTETRIDRYVVRERIGVGGMGVVYAAHDVELDREIAIKLVRAAGGLERDGDRQRLIREARALAQLSHPNVVAVYDVGLHGDRVFIAMELVRGTTLRAHLVAGTTPWTEIVRAYLQAGEGLDAAHRAGLVHRDFKPDNALIGSDARVRVVDFGLAQGAGTTVQLATTSSTTLVTSTTLTATGKVLGTPAYMAPEQYIGEPADALSDQFAFCVSLWETLHGERPFAGTHANAVRTAICEGRIARPARPELAPEWLREVLLRGLARDPGARWPSMRALLDACAKPPRSWRRIGIVAAVAACTFAAVLGGQVLLKQHRAQGCVAEARERASIWNDETASAVATAFTATGLLHARTTAEKLAGQLSRWTAGYADVEARSCVAHRVDGTLDEVAWSLREACLAEHRERLATMVELLLQPDREIVNEAVRAAYDLPSVDGCEDDARLALQAAALGHAASAAAATELRRRVARARQLAAAGRAEPARELALAIHDDAVALGDPALEAESLVGLGYADGKLGDYEDAASAYERAYFIAGPLGADEVAFVAASQLVDIVGVRLARYDDAMTWSRHAEGLLARMGRGHEGMEADLREHVASVLRERGEHVAAVAAYREVIALRVADLGPDHPSLGTTMVNLGSLLARMSDPETTAVLDEAERILVAAHGADTMPMASIESGRCTFDSQRGRFDDAAPHCERGLAIREAQLGADHPSLAIALGNAAISRATRGDTAGARELTERAVAIRRARLSPLHPALATSLNNLGVLDSHADDFVAAEIHLLEALQIRRAVLPPGHAEIATTLINLADIYTGQGQPARAIPLLEEAEQSSSDDPRSSIRGRALAALGRARLDLGEPRQAELDLELAIRSPYAAEGDPAALCELRHDLARALIANHGARSRIRELARQAHAECTEARERGEHLLAELTSWMNDPSQ